VNASEFRPGVDPERMPSAGDAVFVFRGGEVLLNRSGESDAVPDHASVGSLGIEPVQTHYVGEAGDQAVFAVETAPDASVQDPFAFVPLRGTFGLLDEPTWFVAGRASQILHFHSTHRFCGRCGARTRQSHRERAMICPDCSLMAFPRVSPAMIVLIERGDQILMARGPHHAPGMYALLAGFVEIGDSLEDAVRREVREEAGIEVDQIEYFGSQPWPFPHSLMVGFTAQYASGEIDLDTDELEDAQWFSPDAMPPVPPPLSIARKLLDAYARKHGITLREP
jgi:NAD+ diphosphatase